MLGQERGRSQYCSAQDLLAGVFDNFCTIGTAFASHEVGQTHVLPIWQ